MQQTQPMAARLLGLLCLLCLGLSGWALADPPRVEIATPGPHVAPYLPLELMHRLGADRRAGFELSLRYFGGGPLAAKDLLEGNSDFAGLGLPALADVYLDKPELVSIAVITQRPAYVLMVRQALNWTVHGVADLRGRRIGTHTGSKQGKSTARQMAEYLLTGAGVKLGQVNFVHAGQNMADYAAALKSGQVDAIVVNEPAATLLEKQRIAWRLADLHDVQTAKRHLGGRFIYTQLATTRTLLREQPDKARMLVTALRETLAWLASHGPADVTAILGMPDGEETRAWQQYLAVHQGIFSPDGSFTEEGLRNSEAFFKAVGRDLPNAGTLRFSDLVDSRWAGRSP